MDKKEPVYVRYVELTPLCRELLDKLDYIMAEKETEEVEKLQSFEYTTEEVSG